MKVRRAHTTYKWIGKVRGTIPMDFVLYDSHVAIPSINHIRTVHLNPIIDTDQIISLEDIYRKPTALHFQQGTPTLLHLTSLARVHIIVYRYTHTAHQQHTLTILAFLTSACVCLPICTLPWALHSSTPTHTHRQARWHPDLPKFDLIRTALRLTVNSTPPTPTTSPCGAPHTQCHQPTHLPRQQRPARLSSSSRRVSRSTQTPSTCLQRRRNAVQQAKQGSGQQ
jgi:hypothetical protein